MDFSIDKKKNHSFVKQLRTFFETYKDICRIEKGVLVYKNKNVEAFGDIPQVIKQLNMLLSSFTSILGQGILKIYKVKRRDSVIFDPVENALSRVLLTLGDDGIAKCPVRTSGISTGRAPIITKLLESGKVTMLPAEQSFIVAGSEQCTVLIKGKGKQLVTKPKDFEQYLIYYELVYDEDRMKTLRKEISKNGMDNLMKQNKEKMNEALLDEEEDVKEGVDIEGEGEGEGDLPTLNPGAEEFI